MKSIRFAIITLALTTSANAQVMYDFTAPFTAGELNGQQGFAASTTGLTVNPAGTGTVTATLGGLNAYANGSPITNVNPFATGNTLTTSVVFNVSAFTQNPTTNIPVLGSGFFVTGATADSSLLNVRSRSTDGTFQVVDVSNTTPIATIARGDATDVFRFDFTLTLGTSAANSFMSGTLFNVTDSVSSTVLNGGQINGINTNLFTELTTAAVSVGARFGTASLNNANFTSSPTLTVDSFAFNAVPEPSSTLLLLGGISAVVALRRRHN